MFKVKYITNLLLLTFALLTSVFGVSAQSQMRVQGVVLSASDNKPIDHVAITCNFIFLAYTDIDGKFSILVDPNAELFFTSAEYEDSQIAVAGKQTLQVVMNRKAIEIDEIVVTSKIKTKAVSVEPTEIELKGNYFHLKTKFRVPNSQMKTDYRFVLQPIVNDVTKDKLHNLRPVVIDGHNYKIVQNRYYNFGDTVDSLNAYVVPNTIDRHNDVVAYKDSLYVKSADLNNDYKADCYLVMTTYRRPINFDDRVKVVTIARGTVNPFRFFEYSIKPMQLDESVVAEGQEPYLAPTGADTIYIPAPEMELRNSAGSAKIEFEINKTTVNLKNPRNKESVDKMQSILKSVQLNPDATIKSISMKGFASPDGTYAKNKSLADKRTKGMLDLISSVIDESRRKFIDMKSEGVVAPWSSLVDLSKEENPELSTKIADIVKKSGDKFPQSQYLISRLPEYRKEIKSKYLPELRRVEYRIDYSIFRPLTFDEIKELYDKGESLSRHEYYQLVVGEPDSLLRRKFEVDAIEHYPNFMIFVNRKAVSLIQEDSTNMDILAPLLSMKDNPTAVRYNQAIMALRSNELTIADSLVQTIPVNETTRRLHNVVQARNGEYDKVYHYFSAKGGLNEVIILLAMKRNKEAMEKMKILMLDPENIDKAKYNYVLAICANRLDEIFMAMQSLQRAVTLDPKLIEMAKIDSDVLDVYDLIRTDKEESVQ